MTDPSPTPPHPEARETVNELFGDRRVDEYAWLRDRDDPAVIAHLEAENAYCEAALAHTEPMRERIYQEIRSRIKETDDTVPVPHGPWLYRTRTEEGRQYPILVRRPAGAAATDDVVILDVNRLAEGFGYTHLGDAEVSPDHRILAYTVDRDGGERHQLRFRDLESGDDLPDTVDDVSYSLAWAGDSRTVLYTRPDAMMRPFQVLVHVLGTPSDEDRVVHEEGDDRFFASVRRTRSGGLIVVALDSHTTSEALLVDPTAPLEPARVVEPRRPGIEYSVDHHVDPHGHQRLIIVTNDGAPNFRLMEAPVDDPRQRNWRQLLPPDPGVRLVAVSVFHRFMALWERADGLSRLRTCGPPAAEGEPWRVEQPERVSTVHPGDNRDWDSHVLRFHYESLVTPPQTVDLDLLTRTRTVVRQVPVLGGYNPADYRTEQLMATASDGAHIPISVAYRIGLAADGTAPALLYGYGAYEISTEPTFSHSRLSLLDRGVVFAIAHVRGGGERGRPWYLEGKLEHKVNTFTDFIACAERLVEERLTDHDRLAIRGGSAGGLTIGAVVNMRPDIAALAIAHVPFVDVVTTMLDETLPLTVIEREEWGDPRDEPAYRRMLGYSPYDNVAGVRHPMVLATSGLSDPRVGFWEPTKWVARMRDRDTGGGPFLLRTKMGAGHGGPSGRYDAWREEALVIAVVLDRLAGWEDVPAREETAAAPVG